MITVRLFLALLVASGSAHAAGVEHEVDVYVKGMVCSFCAQGLLRSIRANENVSRALVELDERKIRIFVKPDRDLAEAQIKEWVKNSGLGMDRIEVKPD